VSHRPLALILALLLVLAPTARAQSVADTSATPVSSTTTRDTLRFRPDWTSHGVATHLDSLWHAQRSTEWLMAPIGDHLLDDPAAWTSITAKRATSFDITLDYNRVDQARWGVHLQRQRPLTMMPRLGRASSSATGRRRTLYGVQLEQPLLPTARFVFGVGMVRRTEHPELQQVGDLENALALLFARTDYRDHFEREGGGVYLSWRVPDFSTVSVHARRDRWRSLPAASHVVSWFNRGRTLRPIPPSTTVSRTACSCGSSASPSATGTPAPGSTIGSSSIARAARSAATTTTRACSPMCAACCASRPRARSHCAAWWARRPRARCRDRSASRSAASTACGRTRSAR
jgi:hypothetical protein